MNLKSIFDPMGYDDALSTVLRHPGTRCRLRERLEQDAQADPIDALADAELLVELAKVRLKGALDAAELAQAEQANAVIEIARRAGPGNRTRSETP